MSQPSADEIEIVERLRTLGIESPLRTRRLIRHAIHILELDLHDLVILTEAASRNYVCTPIIAAMAGARKVYGLTQDSVYGSVSEVNEATMLLAHLCGVTNMVQVITEREPAIIGQADIVTNLGFVRPIDQEMVSMMKRTAVVPLMCEVWETRAEDVDLEACARGKVPVAGVREDFEGLDIFRSCGQLAMKICFEAGLEVAGNFIILISPDQFGPVIESALISNLAKVCRIDTAAKLTESLVTKADAILAADYLSEDTILAAEIGPTADQLASWNPDLHIIQFLGKINTSALTDVDLNVFPCRSLQPRRMAFTLAHLGARPVIYLHTAGLKVGELLHRGKKNDTFYGRYAPLVQRLV